MKGLLLRSSLLLLSLSFLFPLHLIGQKSRSGVRGKVLDTKGEPVPFVSVGVEKTSIGSMANETGEYQLDLAPGRYTVIFHCIGYQTVKTQIEVSSGYEEKSVTLQEVVITTKEVTIASRNEDPAYSIMRKAIARAKINQMLLDSYKTQVYIRGSGRIIDLPFMMMALAKKEGIDENTVFFTETLEEMEFKQPRQYKERVIAARSTAGKIKINQRFLKEDLYSPQFASTTSPLSPRAFGVYRFQYLGAFTDRGHEVFKIKVIPKIKAQNVWSGEIYIIDDIWCIHSAHLNGVVEGFNVDLAHTYSPLEGIWLPVQIKQEFRGSVLGIEVEFKYNASLSKYRIVKNEKLYAEYQKLEQGLDEKLDQEIKSDPEKFNLKKLEKQDKKILKQFAKAYLKEKYGLKRRKNRTDTIAAKGPARVNVTSTYQFQVDSNAHKKDSTFWLENRAVPLTTIEEKSFHKLDSIRVKEEKQDSAKAKKAGRTNQFSVEDLFLGAGYALGKPDSLKRKPWEIKYFSPLKDLTFNAVEGYAGSAALLFKTYLSQSTNRSVDSRPFLQMGPTVRYSFGRDKVIGSGEIHGRFHGMEARLSGGTEMRQFNEESPVDPLVNSLYALLDTRNFIKLYEADFGRLEFLRPLQNRSEYRIMADWSNRIPVYNTRSKGQWGTDKSFETNQVYMPYVNAPLTGRSVAFTLSAKLDWYPTLTSSLYNDRQYFRASSSPKISFELNHAIPGVGGATADFTRGALSIYKKVDLSDKTELELLGKTSTFIRKVNFGQMDALQVLGNQTFLLRGNPLEQFRKLPYYMMSSQTSTFGLHSQLTRSELIFGWLAMQKKNWKELVIANVMANAGQPVFWEVGYGMDGIARIFHAEVVLSSFNGEAPAWGFLVGGTYNFSIRPSTFNRNP